MVRIAFSWIRFSFVAPWAVICWAVVLLACVLQLASFRSLRMENTGILTTFWRPWFAKVWKFSTTLGRGILYHPSHRDPSVEDDERIEQHERIHVAQVEDLMLTSFLVGLSVSIVTGNVLLGFILWVSGGLWQIPNWVSAVLRYGHHVKKPEGKGFFASTKSIISQVFDIAYRDSEHERSAYAQTDVLGGSVDESWAAQRDKERSL